MKIQISILAILFISIISCRQQSEENVQTKTEVTHNEENTQSTILDAALMAHGGLEKFNSYQTLEFDVVNWPFSKNAPLNDHHTVDIKERMVKIVSDTYQLGSDGTDIWITPNDDTLGVPSNFYYATPYYFIGLPFFLKDDGVIVEELDKQNFEGKSYDAIKITYNNGVGDSSADNYVAYFDEDTHLLKLAHYIVTHPAFAGDKKPEDLSRNSIIYEDYKNTNGLILPNNFSFYSWDDGKLGSKYGSASFENVNLSLTKNNIDFYKNVRQK